MYGKKKNYSINTTMLIHGKKRIKKVALKNDGTDNNTKMKPKLISLKAV